MKKSPDLSETLSKGANEAKEIIHQTAGLIEDEWKRLKGSVEESGSVPDGVKTAVGRLGGAVDDVRGFVTTRGPDVVNSAARAARQAGVPIPDGWGAEESADADAETAAGDEVADDAAGEDEVVEAAVGDVNDDTSTEGTAAADEVVEAVADNAAGDEDPAGDDRS